jgi:hypothetical protein
MTEYLSRKDAALMLRVPRTRLDSLRRLYPGIVKEVQVTAYLFNGDFIRAVAEGGKPGVVAVDMGIPSTTMAKKIEKLSSSKSAAKKPAAKKPTAKKPS